MNQRCCFRGETTSQYQRWSVLQNRKVIHRWFNHGTWRCFNGETTLKCRLGFDELIRKRLEFPPMVYSPSLLHYFRKTLLLTTILVQQGDRAKLDNFKLLWSRRDSALVRCRHFYPSECCQVRGFSVDLDYFITLAADWSDPNNVYFSLGTRFWTEPPSKR